MIIVIAHTLMSDMHLPQCFAADDWDWMQEHILGVGRDIVLSTDDWYNGMYVTGLSGLYDYDGHNSSWQCRKVYFLQVD